MSEGDLLVAREDCRFLLLLLRGRSGGKNGEDVIACSPWSSLSGEITGVLLPMHSPLLSCVSPSSLPAVILADEVPSWENRGFE